MEEDEEEEEEILKKKGKEKEKKGKEEKHHILLPLSTFLPLVSTVYPVYPMFVTVGVVVCCWGGYVYVSVYMCDEV